MTYIPRGGRLVIGNFSAGNGDVCKHVDINAAAVAVGGRVAGDGAAVHGEAALLTHIYAAATAVRRTRSVIGNGAAVHGEARRVGMIRRADKEHTAVVFITGNRSTIHGKGRAGLIVGALFTDLHAAGDRAAVQLKFAAIDEHSALNPAAVGAVSQRQRSAAANRDTAGNRLPVQAEVDLAFWHSPAPRHRLRQIIVASRIRQGIGFCPFCPLCASSVMFVPVDISIPAADAVGMIGLRQHTGSDFRLPAGCSKDRAAVLGLALLTGIPAGRPLCGRNVAAAFVMLAAFMRTA